MVRFLFASGCLSLTGSITPALAGEADGASGPAIVATGKVQGYAPETAAATRRAPRYSISRNRSRC